MILTALECREIDRLAIQELGFPSLVLMENAGRNCADWIRSNHSDPVVAIGAGNGNNGGDGFVIARHLQLMNLPCRVIFLGEEPKLSPDARIQWELCKKLDIEICSSRNEVQWFAPVENHGSPNLVIDAMLGTGAKGGPRPPFHDFILAANRLPVQRVAIDIPTGLDADSGEPSKPTFKADHTLTFIAAKPGFNVASLITGEVSVLSIGLNPDVIERLRQRVAYLATHLATQKKRS